MDFMVLDIETENPGGDPLVNSKRIISVQIGDDKSQKVFYADSKQPDFRLDSVQPEIESLTDRGYMLTGYFIKKFDVPLLKKFLGVDIPVGLYADLIDSVYRLPMRVRRNFSGYSLEHVCNSLGIKCDHKKKMWEKARKVGGYPQAIMHAYNEFVQLGGDKATLFYEYAIGDVISEYQLLGKVTSILDQSR